MCAAAGRAESRATSSARGRGGIVTRGRPGDVTPWTSRPSASVTRTTAARTTVPGPVTPTRWPTSPSRPQSTVHRLQTPPPSTSGFGVRRGRHRAGSTGSSSAPRARTRGVFQPTSTTPPGVSRSSRTHGASGWARATRTRPRTSTATTPGRMADLTPATVVLDKPKTPAVSQPGAVRSRRPRARFDGRRHDAALAADRDARAVRELRPAPEPILRGPAHPHQVLRRCLHLRDARRAARRVRVRAQAPIVLADDNEDQTRSTRIDRPLDFAAVTDHSEFFGEVLLCD